MTAMAGGLARTSLWSLTREMNIATNKILTMVCGTLVKYSIVSR